MFWELIDLEDPFYSSFVGLFSVWNIHFIEVLGWAEYHGTWYNHSIG